MPLQMGDVSTDRPQIVTWDPTDCRQAEEADVRIKHLRAQGFLLANTVIGEAILNPPPVAPNLGVFRILSQNGDDRVVWDRTDPAQVKDAYKQFKALIDKGYTAYATCSDGSKGHKITAFDPGLSEIICVPKTMPG